MMTPLCHEVSAVTDMVGTPGQHARYATPVPNGLHGQHRATSAKEHDRHGDPVRRTTQGARVVMTEHVHAVHPEPDVVQLLTPEGQRVHDSEYDLDITDDEIASLYRDLVLVRRIDTEAIALQRQGELG